MFLGVTPNFREKEAAKIESTCEERLNAELARYGKRLPFVEVALKKAGNVEGVIAIKEEIVRFEKDRTVPDVSPDGLPALAEQARTGFRKAVVGFTSTKNKQTAALIRRYLVPLNELKKGLLVADKLDEAKGVDTEIKRVEFILADIEARLAKPEEKSGEEPQAIAGAKAIGKLPATLARGLVLYYDFDKDEGDKVTDLSGKGNDGKVFGAKWTKNGAGARRTARGWVGGAYDFDGKDDYVEIPNEDSFDFSTGDFTVAHWVRTTVVLNGQNMTTVNKWGQSRGRDNWAFFIFDDDLHFRWSDGSERSVDISDKLTPKQWHHVVVARRGEMICGYLNGVVTEKDVPVRGILRNDCKVRIGSQDAGDRRYFNGSIDGVMIWNRALSDEEIKQLYKLHGGK